MTKEELKKEAKTYAKRKFSEEEQAYLHDIITQTYYDGAEPREKRIAELEQQIEKMKKYGKLLQDICIVMGNDPYVVWAGLQNRVKTLWDTDEEERGYKMTENILDRMLKITAVDWAEISKWEIQ
jgi:flagellar motor component MotA